MEKLERYREINYAAYEGDIDTSTEARYGLPQEVRFCKKCVISNQRPNSCVETKNSAAQKKETIHFGEDGVCDACKAVEKKNDAIDWKEREAELFELCDKYRKNDGSYDCIVPGSGGKDSFYTSYLLRYKYHMHPLTVTWAPHIYTPWGYHNFQAWIASGFDNYLITPNSLTHRLLTRLATEVLLHPFQPFIIGQKNVAPKLAVKFGIPLIFYGENQAEYGNPIKENDGALMDAKFFSAEDKEKTMLGGVSYRDLIKDFKIDPVDLEIYMPTAVDDIKAEGIQMHYLGYYEKWHPQEVYYYCMEHGDFKPSPERTAGTYSKYSSIDDKVDDLHYYTTFIKFGIGRATYDAAQEIRHGELTREEGMALVKKYDGEWPERFEKELMEYLSIDPEHFPDASQMFEQPMMDKEYFMHLCDRFRSPHIWKYCNGKWSLRSTVYDE
ncbi:MAG: N-acetyl sugar amidotransferase [Muribaculum sp.]|nr:N-acetyl sugar amidotransferase [Muribaculum sp.]